MGLTSFLSRLPFCSRIFGKSPIRVLILGLSGGVGKTTVLYRLKEGTTVDCIPTVGFNMETVEINNITFELWDIGGGDKITPLWKHYFLDTKAVIFVIDSTNAENLSSVRVELDILLDAKEIENAPFLLLANKQDKPNAMSLDKIRTKLYLDTHRKSAWKDRSVRLQAAVATQGIGLSEGMEWLCSELAKKK